MKRALLAALLLAAACQKRDDLERPHLIDAAPQLGGGDPAPWIAGRWEKAFDEDNQPKDFLEFRLPAEVESIGANARRSAGKFVLRGTKLRLFFPVKEGKTLEMPLSVSPEHDRLDFVSSNGRKAYYAREPEARPEPVEDTRWLSGTWQRGSESEWLLFNPPAEVGLLRGKPAALVAHGKYSAHGNYVSVLLPQLTLELEADGKRRTLATSAVPQTIYARGSAP